MIVDKAMSLIDKYIRENYAVGELPEIRNEILSITGKKQYEFNDAILEVKSYNQIQKMLSKLNEKESFRKSKGVYYTPNDVVHFIVSNSVKSLYDKLSHDVINDDEPTDIYDDDFSIVKTVFDPTCGAGEYLLVALNIKMDLLEEIYDEVTSTMIARSVGTVYGNDINEESVIITKLRLFLYVLNRFGYEKCKGISEIINNNFSSYDYVLNLNEKKYDMIVGNPPYVEDFKSGLNLKKKYGNIYANVIINAAKQLSKNGSMGFIIPLSYISTPRMKELRNDLSSCLSKQYILSYADRPDCLFDTVHQKLCILIGSKSKGDTSIYTSEYQYWYKKDRNQLFKKINIVKNVFVTDKYIPKLGTHIDINIYRKIMMSDRMISVYEVSRAGSESVYLNRRETFWMKAYREKVNNPEYKVFSFQTEELADYCYCLINSSLFWWFWICTSDCWHVSKELNDFKAPFDRAIYQATPLSYALRKKLEETKVYVGTKQTEYEYKHKYCIPEIHRIDDFVNGLYDLSDEENQYIKGFAFRYRTSGGSVNYEGN